MKSVILAAAVFLCNTISLCVAQNPVPFVNQPLVPSAAAPSGAGFTLTVNGTGFLPTSVVNWNGGPRATTFVSAAQLTAAILSSDIATVTTASITVSSPAPGGGTSNIAFFPVEIPEPAATFYAQEITNNNPYQSLAVGDFNGDGNQDVAVAGFGGNLTRLDIFLGKGDGTLLLQNKYFVPADYLISVDANGDGKADLVFATKHSGTASLGVMLGNGDGTFQPPVYYAVSICCQLVAGDFNHDGTIDIATADKDQVCVLPGNGDGTFGQEICSSLPGTKSSYLAVGDFNFDGNLDLAVADESGSIFILSGNGDGTFLTTETYPIVGRPVWVSAADFNNDGNLDLAVAADKPGSIVVLNGNGDGTFQSANVVTRLAEPVSVLPADVNGDGKVDLIFGGMLTGLVSSVSVALGNGDGTFQSPSNNPGHSPLSMSIADFDNNGRADITFVDTSLDTLTVLLQNYLSASPDQLKFPSQLINTVSQPKIITLTNLGNSRSPIPLTVPPAFSQQAGCKSIPPGGTCKVAIFFTPTEAGNVKGALSIHTKTENVRLAQLSGVATQISFSPASVDFGSWPVGHISTPQYVVMSNVGSSSVSIKEIGISGTDASDFHEVNACPKTLTAGGTCTIAVYFDPTTTGSRTAILGIEDNGGGSPQKVPLSGVGQ